MTTFAEAIALAYEQLSGSWPEDQGTFHIDPEEGWEDDDGYLLTVGAREFLVDGNQDYFFFDDRTILVDKNTGEATYESFMALTERINGMVPVETDELDDVSGEQETVS